MVTHHVLDALAVLPHLSDSASRPRLRVLDVGSGGGVPAIPLAIARPALARRRARQQPQERRVPAAGDQRAAVCRTSKRLIARVEDYAPAAPFDVVISRAFSDLATFVETSARHLAPGGRLIAMKGVFPDEEIASCRATVRVVAAPALAVPGLDAERHLIVMARA